MIHRSAQLNQDEGLGLHRYSHQLLWSDEKGGNGHLAQ